ncbi:N-acetylmuramoyl-L-alanine amidase [Clostridium tarantellae]|uniref:MurNAc-LAA domain-containing protein n=1 Tax=Clostridium tarantellae TaxID=39493 RepID=A0A6I1MTH7_9CLOT|nr:N-acetylmuramoyl-L-alanine amidase [Clostridium tarantellae]MPQ43539.1 hypothetical protein [Clostridium tarantellae]
MRKHKCKISIFILLVFIFSIIPSRFVHAMENINIISKTTITREDARSWAYKRGATKTFMDLVDLYWDSYEKHGQVNPAIAYVQSALETNFGNFGGILNESYKNPCGMKNTVGGGDDDANAHHKFNSWSDGVTAHLDHLALYAGGKGYPKGKNETNDARHFAGIYGIAPKVLDLSSNWASSKSYGKDIIDLYNELDHFSKTRKKSKMNLEKPSESLKIEGNTLKVTGWVLQGFGVKEVKIYLDNEYIGNAQLGIKRADVNKAFSNYPNGENSGFAGEFNINHVTPGKKIVKAEAIGNDGTIITRTARITLEKKPAKMNLEAPKQNLVIEGNTLNIKGWALHGSEVKEIKVYLNNEYVGNANLGIKRFDVNRVFKGYPNGENSGFSGEFNISHITPGEKIIKVEVIGKDNSVISQNSKINLKKKPAKMNLEAPKQNFTTDNNTLSIKGWALHGSGVKEIKVYLDNNFVGNANLGIDRPDVNKVFKDYPNGKKSGFTGEFNISNFTAGQKTIKVEAIGNDGSKINFLSKINLKKKPAKMNFEKSIITVEGNKTYLNILGWALHGSGVKEIKVYADNNYLGNANLGIDRQDVNRTFKGYLNGEKSGFNGKFDMQFIAPGTKSIKIEVIGNDNTKITRTSQLVLKKKIAKINLENPVDATTLKGRTLKIKGWALNDSGVKEVKVYVDNNYLGSANLNIDRVDVNKAFPNYINGNKSGFTGEFDVSNFARGYHKVKIIAIGNDNTTKEMSKLIKLNHKKFIVIDPGHNTNPAYRVDTGSSFSHNGNLYKECELNMELAVKLRDELSKLGYEVVLTQSPFQTTYDKTVVDSLDRRTSLANDLKADLFISVHHNEFESIMAYGTETWYSDFREVPCSGNAIESSEALAKALADTLAKSGNFYNRGAKSGRLYVTRKASMPSVLIEAGFLSNPNDATKAADENHQRRVANALAHTVDNWFKEN